MSRLGFDPLDRNPIAVGYALVTALTVALYTLGITQWMSPGWLSALVVLFALGKSAVFVLANLRMIIRVTMNHSPFHRYLVFLVLSLSLVIFSFALDSFLLVRLVPGSYEGFAKGLTTAELLFECYYFSFLNLTIYGVVEIVPKTVAAKTLLMAEEALVFLTLVYILSDFISLRDSIRETIHREGGSGPPQSPAV